MMVDKVKESLLEKADLPTYEQVCPETKRRKWRIVVGCVMGFLVFIWLSDVLSCCFYDGLDLSTFSSIPSATDFEEGAQLNSIEDTLPHDPTALMQIKRVPETLSLPRVDTAIDPIASFPSLESLLQQSETQVMTSNDGQVSIIIEHVSLGPKRLKYDRMMEDMLALAQFEREAEAGMPSMILVQETLPSADEMKTLPSADEIMSGLEEIIRKLQITTL